MKVGITNFIVSYKIQTYLYKWTLCVGLTWEATRIASRDKIQVRFVLSVHEEAFFDPAAHTEQKFNFHSEKTSRKSQMFTSLADRLKIQTKALSQ